MMIPQCESYARTCPALSPRAASTVTCGREGPQVTVSAYKGKAVVFFTVRSTSIELDRNTPGKRGSTSA